jgi:hypothetical protein
MIGGAEDDAFFEEVAQTDAAEISLDHSAHNILQVKSKTCHHVKHTPMISMMPFFVLLWCFSLSSFDEKVFNF